MAKKGKKGYRPAPWSDDYKSPGAKAPWYRKRPKGERSPWSNPLAGFDRGGRR